MKILAKFKMEKLKTFFQKRKKIIFTVLVFSLFVGAYFLNNYVYEQKMVSKRRKVMEKQAAIMKDYWTKKGLTQEEIHAKMKSYRGGFNRENMTDEQKAKMREQMQQNGDGFGSGSGAVRGVFRMAH